MLKIYLSLLTVSLCLLGIGTSSSQAQIESDETVGTRVTSSNQLNFSIDGGQQSGGNLFQSFRTFSVPTGGSAVFNNGPTITNIISRVTGPAASNIDGLIQAQSDANLFFINPNGIFFGPNARLGLGGSFLASTADRILFAASDVFSATQPTPLLTVRAPIGLGFGATAAPIQNQSRVTGQLGRPGAVGTGTVGLQVNQGKTVALVGGNINLEGGVISASSGRVELASVRPNSRVDLSTAGNNLTLEIPAGTNLGNIALSQRAMVTARGQQEGSVEIQGQQLTLLDSNINATLDRGGTASRGGNINIQVPGRVVVNGISEIAARTRSSGTAGTIFIETGQLILSNGGKVSSSTFGPGKAGTVIIDAADLVQVSGRDSDNRGLQSAIFSQSVGNVTGDAGRVRITTQRLVVEGGAEISVGAVAEANPQGGAPPGTSTGNGGDLSIVATDSIVVTGTGLDGEGTRQPSALIAEAQGPGNAGKLRLETNQLLVQDQGTVTVRSLEGGSAGNLSVTANTIRLEEQGQLNAETKSGSGGNISLQVAELLLLRSGSTISTSGGIDNAAGNGGNIRITAPLVVAVLAENSDIRTDAFTGNGGAVSITTEGLLGLRSQPTGTDFSDITANSQLGLDGVVQINTLELDPSKNTVTLPETVRTAVLTQDCQADKQGGSQFIDTQRGGKPLGPQEIGSQSIWDDLRPLPRTNTALRLRSLPTSSLPPREAQGWARNATGNLVLLAQVPAVTPNALTQAAVPCRSYK